MTAVNPFKAPGRWFRGNTHSHSTESDGRLSIQDRFAAYRDGGYDFLVLTDHRKVSDVSAESRPHFLAISGSEVHPDNPYGGDRYHFVAINIHEPIRDTELHPNEAIEAVRAQGGEVVVCHPYWCGHTINDLQPLQGYFALEVFNATCMAIGKGFSEPHWDDLLDKAGPTFGIAADDAHGTDLDVFQGWISVKARELTIGAILDALRTGAYYSTMGPEILDLDLIEMPAAEGGQKPTRKVVVRCSPAQSITFKAHRSRGRRILPASGDLLTEAEYPLSGGERYVRVEIIAPDGKKAWSNPLFF
jgi:predicted metal-dependent phosphoesterase TrpH